MNRKFLVWLTFIAWSALFFAGCQPVPPQPAPTPKATPIAVRPYSNQAAFDLLYPAYWSHYVVGEGLLLFGEPQTISLEENGASVAVLRIAPENTRGELNDALQHYLDSGPLPAGYAITREKNTTRVDGQDALRVSLAFQGDGEIPPMQAYVVATKAESGAVYIFTATAPRAEWAAHEDEFLVLVDSVEFNE